MAGRHPHEAACNPHQRFALRPTSRHGPHPTGRLNSQYGATLVRDEFADPIAGDKPQAAVGI
jgi:hypothetical protein